MDHDLPEAGTEWRPKPRHLMMVVGAIILVALLLFGWRSWRNATPDYVAPPPTQVTALEVVPRTLPASLQAVGTLRAVQEVVLAPEVAGRVTDIHFRAGARVQAGALLVQLYDGPEQADRAAAVARANFAKLQLARARDLVDSGAESAEILQQSEAEQQQAEAAVRQYDARIRQKRVVAPFAGELGIRQINLGEYLNPGQPIVTLTALQQIYVDFSLPQQDLGTLKPGAHVEVRTDAWPGRVFRGKVTTIEPQVGEDSRTIMVQALIANGDHALRPGMYVTADLVQAPETNLLVLPLTAIQTSAVGDSVTVVRGENPKKAGKADIVPVETGRRVGSEVVVVKGLAPGDIVVAEGQIRVQPGADVEVSGLIPPSAGPAED